MRWLGVNDNPLPAVGPAGRSSRAQRFGAPRIERHQRRLGCRVLGCGGTPLSCDRCWLRRGRGSGYDLSLQRCSLNLASIFHRFLYSAGAKAGIVLRAGYASRACVALLSATGFLTLTGHHDYIPAGTVHAALFVVAVALWTVFTIEDAALTGLPASFWVPVENTSFAMAKLVCLPLFAAITPLTGVFDSWTLPLIGCIVPVNYYIFRRLLPEHLAMAGNRVSLPSPRVVGSIVVGRIPRSRPRSPSTPPCAADRSAARRDADRVFSDALVGWHRF